MKYLGWCFFVLTTLLVFACRQAVDRNGVVIASIRQTGQLVTAEYSLRKIVRAADNRTWYKIGERQILISAQAIVKAGVDLQNIAPEDVAIDGETIRINLPPAQVFSLSLPPDGIQVLYENNTLFRDRFSAAEREALLRQAETQIRSLTDSLGILKTAQTNADIFLRKLLQQGGFTNVTITYSK